ncbi:uncharacterized protein H6S33_003472 [Morchella sextelata]|uniref:uncharacterized protein n=1 Tax=Morchella sextelata TaxID=1174677 RepID=UPI001D05ADC6|nr:uncharacterized protein H6S33_003472 [Morchella sextelata]KAH0606638.1 hypothetical protein H6S33_003472 [Morchella sextelata]
MWGFQFLLDISSTENFSIRKVEYMEFLVARKKSGGAIATSLGTRHRTNETVKIFSTYLDLVKNNIWPD